MKPKHIRELVNALLLINAGLYKILIELRDLDYATSPRRYKELKSLFQDYILAILVLHRGLRLLDKSENLDLTCDEEELREYFDVTDLLRQQIILTCRYYEAIVSVKHKYPELTCRYEHGVGVMLLGYSFRTFRPF